MKFRAMIKQSGDWWIGWLIDLPGVNAQEKTKEELLESLKIGTEDLLKTEVPFEAEAQMTTIEIPSPDEALKHFIDYRDSISSIDRVAPYHWYKIPSAASLILVYGQMLDEHSIELANSINEFSRYIANIEALKVIIDGCDDKTKYEYLVEFVTPFATLAINMPYVIQNRFIYSISHLCHQSNITKEVKWIDDLPLEDKINFNVADKYCSKWKEYKKLKIILEKINNRKFQEATKEFRNKYNHRYSMHIEIGLTEFIKRVVKDNGKVIYGIGSTKPLKIDQLLIVLKEQHSDSLDAFDQYQKLIHEQILAFESWNKLELEKKK